MIFCLTLFSFTLFKLVNTFYPADDYAIYIHFAEAAANGYNPYSLPADYRSTVPPTFFPVGWLQSLPGQIPHVYADNPPLLMLLNSWAFRLHETKGLYWTYIALYAVSCLMYCLYARTDRQPHRHSAYLFAVFLALNPMIVKYWFLPIEDKVWFLLCMLVCLLVRNRRHALTVALALFAALKGLGIIVFVFYLMFIIVTERPGIKALSGLALLFALVVAATHTIYFPDWMNGYRWRAGRQNWVAYASVFVPLAKAGLFWSGMGKVLTVGALLVLAVATVKKKLTLQEVLLLPIVASIVFNTELGFDRLLVAILALLLLSDRSYTVLIAYLAGALVTLPYIHQFLPIVGSGKAQWLVMWCLTAFLVGNCAVQVARRKNGLASERRRSGTRGSVAS